MRKLTSPGILLAMMAAGKMVPLDIPPPYEVPDYVPSAEEVEKMRRAQEKRDRKAQKKK